MSASHNRQIQIGSVWTLTAPTNWTWTPDDRQQKIEIINGVAIQDYGHVTAGDSITFEAKFKRTAWETIWNYWTNRTLVTITDMSGTQWQGCRILIKSYGYVDYFERDTVQAQIEVWRV